MSTRFGISNICTSSFFLAVDQEIKKTHTHNDFQRTKYNMYKIRSNNNQKYYRKKKQTNNLMTFCNLIVY